MPTHNAVVLIAASVTPGGARWFAAATPCPVWPVGHAPWAMNDQSNGQVSHWERIVSMARRLDEAVAARNGLDVDAALALSMAVLAFEDWLRSAGKTDAFSS